jgi:hypothetical protein
VPRRQAPTPPPRSPWVANYNCPNPQFVPNRCLNRYLPLNINVTPKHRSWCCLYTAYASLRIRG